MDEAGWGPTNQERWGHVNTLLRKTDPVLHEP